MYTLDPSSDPRWARFVDDHPRASIFHTPGWLAALQQCYGYRPIVYTTCAAGEQLTDGIPFCEVRSWLTGRRLVSVPFADHCEPLTKDSEQLDRLLEAAQADGARAGVRYVEIRPLRMQADAGPRAGLFGPSARFDFHEIDLEPSLAEIQRRFHESSVRRKIRRSAREGLEYREGSSDGLLDDFYRLLLMTRRRHGLVPQSRRWFRILLDCLGDRARICAAYQREHAVAAIVVCAVGDTHVYKYGASDSQASNLGGTALLFDRMISEAKARGAVRVDLGRSAVEQDGLSQFKERWGGRRSALTYYRAPAPRADRRWTPDWPKALVTRLVQRAPDRVLTVAGEILYRHAG